MPTTLPPSADYTGASVTQGGKKNFVTAMRSFINDLFGTDSTLSSAHGVFKSYGPGSMNNAGLAATVAGNALTIALKTAGGADPSAMDPVLHSFRSPTAGTGTTTLLAATAAQSLVIPSTATMGASNGTPFRLWIVQFNDAGILRLGAVNCLTGSVAAGWSIYPLRDEVIASSTAVGTGSDSAHVIYTGTAVTSKAVRVLGWLEWSAGLTTAGTWDAVPTKIQMYAAGQSLPGHPVQVQENSTGAVATGTTSIPVDDTIPQITEGDQYLSQAITPSSIANVLLVEMQMHLTNSAGVVSLIAGLFQDAGASALAGAIDTSATAGGVAQLSIAHRMRAGTTSATTFKGRGGASAVGTTTFNGSGGARLIGGTLNSFMRVTEVMA